GGQRCLCHRRLDGGQRRPGHGVPHWPRPGGATHLGRPQQRRPGGGPGARRAALQRHRGAHRYRHRRNARGRPAPHPPHRGSAPAPRQYPGVAQYRPRHCRQPRCAGDTGRGAQRDHRPAGGGCRRHPVLRCPQPAPGVCRRQGLSRRRHRAHLHPHAGERRGPRCPPAAPGLRRELLAAEQFVAYGAVPLVAKGRTLGVLEVFDRETRGRDGEWRALFETLGGQVAIAMDSALLFRDLGRKHQELVVAYEDTLEGWARALALKEEETESHSRRVVANTLAIAREMGVGDDELVHVRRGALLHDIGKIGIPDAILLKPGKLSAEEWEIMKRHTLYGFEMLSPIPYLRQAADIPYCHHERWDGSGYPRGLKGKQIPLAARIFAVVDVCDALASERPYKRPWPLEEVMAYLREQRGKHFDPEVVDCFIAWCEGHPEALEAAPSQADGRPAPSR